MAHFESPCQIAGLFISAVLVSFAVIYVLRWEATKRYGEDRAATHSDVPSTGNYCIKYMNTPVQITYNNINMP